MIIIPARLNSTRFERKILRQINGLPMFLATAKKASEVDEVCIAVDNEEILELAKKHGFCAVLTKKIHESGTDRIFEACKILRLKDEELIINVQADEPFIERENLALFKAFCEQNLNESFMFSCYKKISEFEAENPNLVKLITDKNDFALYFSRAKIPFERTKFSEDFKGHLGIYGYKVSSLREFVSFKNSALEMAEKLEQLRVLENGKKIKMLEISTKSIGIDTLEDYEKALREFC